MKPNIFVISFLIGVIVCGFAYLVERKKINKISQAPLKNFKTRVEGLGRYLLDNYASWGLGILFFIILFLPFWYSWNLSNTILALTAWAVLLYTWKTWQLKDLTSAQLSYNMRPLVVLTDIEKDSNYTNFREKFTIYNGESCRTIRVTATLKNIGEGIATNIATRPIKVWSMEDKKVYVYIEELNGLTKGDMVKVNFITANSTFLGTTGEDKLLEGETEDSILRIDYRDVQGRLFYTNLKRKELGGKWNFSEAEAI